MTKRFPCIAACSILVAACAVVAADKAAPEEYARNLGSPDFRTREAASKILWSMGEKARPALEEAANGTNVEGAVRAQSVLDKFDWGLYADASPDAVELIRSFRTGTYEWQQEMIFDLLKNGSSGIPTLRVLLAKEFAPDCNNPPADARNVVFARLNEELRQRVPGLIRDGHFDDAEALLALQTLGLWPPGHLDFAAFVAARGTVKRAAAGLTSRRPTGMPDNGLPLIFLYRAADDRETGRKTLARLPADDPLSARVREAYLVDTDAWGELADAPAAKANSPLGVEAFRLRKAGKLREADAVLGAAMSAPSATSVCDLDPAAMALIMNGRVEDGLVRMAAVKSDPYSAVGMLAARSEFAAALDLIAIGLNEKARPGDPLAAPVDSQLKVLYSVKRATILAQLGDRMTAEKIFAAVNGAADTLTSFQLAQAVKAEIRSGFADRAAELTGFARDKDDRALEAGRNPGRFTSANQDAYAFLFDDDADAAHYWWVVMRAADPNALPGKRMRDVRDLVRGAMPKAGVERWLMMAEDAKPPNRSSVDGYRRAMGLTAAYRAVGEPGKAVATLSEVADALVEKSASGEAATSVDLSQRSWVFGDDEGFRLWTDLGDMLAARGDHDAAAKRYEQGWRRYPNNPVPLYLAGAARTAAGNAGEGNKLKEAAHLVPLGNARARCRFLRELMDRAAPTADLRRARDDARRCAWMNDRSVESVWNYVSRASAALGDFAAAADARGRAIQYVLRTAGVSYWEGSYYIGMPAFERSLRARQLLAQGKPAEAVAAAREALAIEPGYNALVLGMVPELDKLGRSKEADELYLAIRKPLVKLVAEYPRSGWARTKAAWAAVGGRRDLDAALADATKAVELEPTNRSFRECLAEVRFCLRQRAAAVKIAAALVAEEPRNRYYGRLLERYKTTSFDSPLPVRAD